MKSRKRKSVGAGKVLACVDQSRYADYVTDYAAWATRRKARDDSTHFVRVRGIISVEVELSCRRGL